MGTDARLGLLVTAEAGYRLGGARPERVDDAGHGHPTGVQASLLALLGLLLGFTLHMANVRFDARRPCVIDAANTPEDKYILAARVCIRSGRDSAVVISTRCSTSERPRR